VASALVQRVKDSKPTFSVELWPPRSETAQKRLEVALGELREIGPDFVSITYGAGGSTRDRTHSLVVEIAEQGWTIPMAHLTCAAHSKGELETILLKFKAANVNDVLALRGDPPLEGDGFLPKGELDYAYQLVELAKELADFGVAVAVHPEGHPASKDLKTDRIHLKRKLELADFGVTQFYFTHEAYERVRDQMSTLGVDRPIVPGIMAPTSWSTLQKMAELSGTTIPSYVVDLFDSVGGDPKEIRKVGVDIAIQLCISAIEAGAPGVHIYSMNSAEATREIYDAVKPYLQRD
jgi:methylenetetrahydrofolate reductase (NADPH)